MASPQFHKFLELLKRNGPLTDEVKPESMRRNLDKVGGKPPTTWPEFFALADKMKAAGMVAIAHGDTPYQVCI